jgi:hypothetical protein
LHFHCSKSFTAFIGATMTAASSGLFVPGVQAMGIERKGSARGAIIHTWADSIHHPRPNSKPSVWTFFSPYWRNFPAVQRSASRIAGELVRRPPMRSAR